MKFVYRPKESVRPGDVLYFDTSRTLWLVIARVGNDGVLLRLESEPLFKGPQLVDDYTFIGNGYQYEVLA